MVLEATLICIDNSEWLRNGDYIPSRIEALQDAVGLIAGAKTQSNPESTVGILTFGRTSAGTNGTEVLATLTQDIGKILSALQQIKVGGESDLSAALQVAQLVLKHRLNKHQHQRIVVFVASPITTETQQLVKIAQLLRKNSIAVDIVNFGEERENTEKLEAFIAAVNNNNNSHLVTVPSGPHILSDILVTSPLLNSEDGPISSTAGLGGIDAEQDPELMMILQLSLEEERKRQEAEAKRKQEESQSTESATPSTSAPATTTTTNVQDTNMDDDDDELARAIALSKQTEDTPMAVDNDDDLELAKQLSMTTQQSQQGDDVSNVVSDPDFMRGMLSNLEGVDPNDERIKSVLESLKKKDEDQNKQ